MSKLTHYLARLSRTGLERVLSQNIAGPSMRTISENGLALIKQYEGFAAHIYICPAGYATIGYGHVVQRGESFDEPIEREEAEALLKSDVKQAELAVARYIDVPLTTNQFDALVSFTFNLGAGALQRSTLRRKVNRSEHAQVPSEFNRWVYAGGKKLKGLIARRQTEAALYAQ